MVTLIDAHLAHCQVAGLAPLTTIAARGQLLRRIDAALPFGLEQASVDELTGWLAGPPSTRERRGWSAQTRATYYSHVRAFFLWACDPRRPLLDYDPSALLPVPRVPKRAPRPCTDAELAHALTRLADPWRLYVLLAAAAGLRCCEIATLAVEDITEDYLVVVGKGGATAAIPTHPELWRAVAGLPPGPVAWRVLSGRQPSANYISVNTARHLRRVGLAAVTLHRFRHWMGTTALDGSGNLRVVQELMRHASPNTTAGYTQITDRARRAAIHALPIPTVAA